MEVLAVIPARGGSKGIKRKNLVQLLGKPLLAYSIEHALQSKLVNRVIVSSDDSEILDAARKFGAEVPFVRPAELAQDSVLDIPVFQHALSFLKESENYVPEVVVHLRPTAPYRKSSWIDEAIGLMLDHPEADSVRSVSEPEKHPYRMFKINREGYLDSIMKHEHPVPYLLRRQDLPKIYFYNCVIDITKPSTVFDKNSMTGDLILPFIMDSDDVIDIDSPRDLDIAEFLMRKKQQ